jgi:hypothetical protein
MPEETGFSGDHKTLLAAGLERRRAARLTHVEPGLPGLLRTPAAWGAGEAKLGDCTEAGIGQGAFVAVTAAAAALWGFAALLFYII